jgi:hypothetical protein
MTEETNQANPLFLHLVLSLQSAAMYQLGKIVSPISGQIERDLEQARISIDLLIMLQEKTRGNLLEEEKRVLDSIIYNLQMNYIDELNKDKSPDTQAAPETASGQADEGSSSSSAS